MMRAGIFVFLVFLSGFPLLSHAQDIGTKGFFASWKLMNTEEKRQFLSGYKYASEDIQDILNIAIEFIKENPEQAVSGLETLQKLYDFSSIGPDTLVTEVDRYYRESKNREASLSQAMTAARNNIR